MASLMLLFHAFSWYSVLIYLRFKSYAFHMVLSYARGSWRFLEYLYYMGLSENMVYPWPCSENDDFFQFGLWVAFFTETHVVVYVGSKYLMAFLMACLMVFSGI
jgi:hypothetical protein